jgi:hypothetical protein
VEARAGDRIVVESEGVTKVPRSGVIEEVLEARPARFRVRWDDGRESIFVPAGGAARIEPRSAKSTSKAKAKAS